MKTKFGAIVVDGRGKLGGHVFSKNAAGSYMRTKTTPTNPQTSYQTAVRVLFALISSGWSGLSNTVRNAWNDAVSEWQTTDVFGDLKKPTGKALYQRLNNQAQSAGFSAVTTPPAKVDIPDGVITFGVFSLGLGELDFTGLNITGTQRNQMFGTTKLSQGTSFVKNKLRQFYSDLAVNDDNAANFDAYVNRFGTPVLGDNIYLGVKYVMPNGQTSPMQVMKAMIIA
jgi:hypothetical protein